MRIAFEYAPTKSDYDKSNLEFAFRDIEGRVYYRFTSDDDIPILRKLEITKHYVDLVNGFTDTTLNASLMAIYGAINEKDAKGHMRPNIANAAAITARLLTMSGQIINENALYSLAANYFIREDEDIAEPDESITRQKIQSLTNENKEGVKRFFFEKSLNKLFPFLVDGDALFNELLDESRIQTMAFFDLITKTNGNTE